MMMQPKPVPLSNVDDAHITAMVQSYLVAHGFHRTATALRNTTPKAAADLLPTNSDNQGTKSRYDLCSIVSDTSKKVGLLFDDDSAWPIDNMAQNEIQLQIIDSHTGASGGTLDTLIEKLIFDDSSFATTERGDSSAVDLTQINFVSVFMVTSCCFATPDALFSKLSKLFKSITGQAVLLGEFRRVMLLKRILNFLLTWTTLASIDFRRVVAERMASFAMSVVRSGGHHYEVVQLATALLQNLQALLDDKKPYDVRPFPAVQPRALEPVPATVPADTEYKRATDAPDAELARQLCLAHFALFSEVRPRELFNEAWEDPTMALICGSLNAFMKFPEDITQWFASMIVAAPDAAARRAIYAKTVRVAHQLYNMQNHFLAAALLMACTHQAVQPLVDNSVLNGEESESFDALRTAMDVLRVAKKELPIALDTACIPHARLYLGQMSRAHETSKTFVKSDAHILINWSKMISMGRVVLSFISLQAVPYPYQPLPHFQRLIRQMPGKRDDDALNAISQERVKNTRR